MSKENKKRFLILIGLLAIVIFFYNFNLREDIDHKNDEYWTAVHYFADAWPVNMWDSEFETVDEDFEKISNDGFNTIILLVPWREFQPEYTDKNNFNTEAITKLKFLTQKAKEYDLGVMVRLGYSWDCYDNRSTKDLIERYQKIFYDNETRNAWLNFSKKIYNTLNKYENFEGGFICWEDFWGVINTAKELSGNNDLSKTFAQNLGYSKYMITEKSLILESVFGASDLDEDDIYIPSIDRYGFNTFYEYYDILLYSLLLDTQSVFQNISMEVRTDADLVKDELGNDIYYNHTATYTCGNSDYSALVYGIPMGFVNKGELVTWDEALSMTDTILDNVSQNTNGKLLFVEQFLFYDNTQGFSHNAQIKYDQIDDYINNCAPVLKKYSKGYGIWTYKDYFFDAISNGMFAKGLDSWNVTNGVVIEKDSKDKNKCYIPSNGNIVQIVQNKVSTIADETICSLYIEPKDGKAKVTIVNAGNRKQLVVEDAGVYTLKFEGTNWGEFSITSDSDICVDNIRLYNYMQEGLIYNIDGTEDICADAIRELNQTLLMDVELQYQ